MNPRVKVIDICKQMVNELSMKEIVEATPFFEVNSAVVELGLLLGEVTDNNAIAYQSKVIDLKTRMQAIYNTQTILAISSPPLRHQLEECIEALGDWIKLFAPKSRRSSLFEVELAKVIPTEEAAEAPDSPNLFATCLTRISRH